MEKHTKAPSSDGLELMILGVYLNFPALQEKMDKDLAPDLFLNENYNSIIIYIKTQKFKTMAPGNGASPYPYTVFADSLGKNLREFKKCGGPDVLCELRDIDISAGWQNALDQLKDYATRRQIMANCENIFNCCASDFTSEIGELISDFTVLSEYASSGPKAKNLTQQVEELIENTTGIITASFVFNCLQLSSRKDKKNVNQILNRMKKKKVIEATGQSPGQYRKIDSDFEFEDWTTSDESPVDINLPLGLTRYCEIYPGDIVIFAGSKSTGKTALALETIRLNKREWECIYHSSELNKQTFKRRLSRQNNFRIDEWRNVKFVGSLVADSAMDRVQPNSLNIFDYIESDDGSYYKIPGYIAKIHHALKSGVAIICLQKDTFKPYADGGEKTRQKANLYCVLQPDYPGQKLIIDNCKAWREEETNPGGFEVNYKIVNGINIMADGFLMPGLEK